MPKRLTFALWQNGQEERSFTLTLNPEQYTQEHQGRGAVTYTQGGGWLDADGEAVPVIAFSGHTGFRPRAVDGLVLDGFEVLQRLKRDIIQEYLRRTKDESLSATVELRFYNWLNREYYAVYPPRFQLQQSAREPLLYRYSVTLQCLRELSIPTVQPDVIAEAFTVSGQHQRVPALNVELKNAVVQMVYLTNRGALYASSDAEMRRVASTIANAYVEALPSNRPTEDNFPALRDYRSTLASVVDRLWTLARQVDAYISKLTTTVAANRAAAVNLAAEVTVLADTLEDTAKFPAPPYTLSCYLRVSADKVRTLAVTPDIFRS